MSKLWELINLILSLILIFGFFVNTGPGLLIYILQHRILNMQCLRLLGLRKCFPLNIESKLQAREAKQRHTHTHTHTHTHIRTRTRALARELYLLHSSTVNSRYLEFMGTIFHKFKLPEVQINLHFG